MENLVINKKYFAGIGSSHTTPDRLKLKFSLISTELESLGYILRSGGAEQCDTYFESGIKNDNNKEIWLIQKGFHGNKSKYILENLIPTEVEKITKEIYVRWNFVNNTVKRFHARNVYQILGHDLITPVKFVVCYTDRPEQDCGGTMFGIKLAKKYCIPTYNFYYEQEEKDFDDLMSILKGEK